MLRPEVHPSRFSQIALSYTFYGRMVPLSHTRLERCIPFNCCKWKWISLNQIVSFSHPWNAPVSPFRPSHKPQWQISLPSLPFLILQLMKSLPFSYTWSLKKVPLSGGASPYRPLGSTPPGEGLFIVSWLQVKGACDVLLRQLLKFTKRTTLL